MKANCFTLHSSTKEEQNVEKPANIKSVVNDQSSTLTQRDLHGNTINYSPSLINSHETNIEDCEATNGLSKSNNFKNTTNRKKGERYLPHFKHEVVTFALKYSIKEAAFCYKVNKGTISDWIREDNKFATLNIRKLKVCYLIFFHKYIFILIKLSSFFFLLKSDKTVSYTLIIH